MFQYNDRKVAWIAEIPPANSAILLGFLCAIHNKPFPDQNRSGLAVGFAIGLNLKLYADGNDIPHPFGSKMLRHFDNNSPFRNILRGSKRLPHKFIKIIRDFPIALFLITLKENELQRYIVELPLAENIHDYVLSQLPPELSRYPQIISLIHYG